LYENGLIVRTKNMVPLHYSSIKTIIHIIDKNINNDGVASYSEIYKIYCHDGTELSAKNITDGTFVQRSAIIQAIEKGSAPYLLEEILKQYRSTHQVYLGAACLDKDGITSRASNFPGQSSRALRSLAAIWLSRKRAYHGFPGKLRIERCGEL